MMDAVEHACLTLEDNPRSNDYLNLSSGMGPILRAFHSGAATRHGLWLSMSGSDHLCRCMVAALRDKLNEMLAEPVVNELACERWTPELKQSLLEFHREAPHPSGPDPDGWYDTADERKAEIFARPGMFKDAD